MCSKSLISFNYSPGGHTSVCCSVIIRFSYVVFCSLFFVLCIVFVSFKQCYVNLINPVPGQNNQNKPALITHFLKKMRNNRGSPSRDHLHAPLKMITIIGCSLDCLWIAHKDDLFNCLVVVCVT